jgi:hypothetical protein
MKRALLCSLLVYYAAAQAQENANRMPAEAVLPQLLWREPRPATVQDWACGFAGCDHAPAAPFYFVKEDREGTTPKVSGKDARGRFWSVKFGSKAVPECFGSRFVAAMGYVVETSYYIESGRLEGATRLDRARRIVKPDGSFACARFQLRDEAALQFLKDHAWSLADNPFRGSHEFAGLRVLMMLLSNWDAKDSRNGQDEANTGVFRSAGSDGHPELLYSFFDWGSTLGRWGKLMRRDRSDCSGFVQDTPVFVTGVRDGVVAWGYSGKHEEDVKAGITLEDLRWLMPYLARITDEEIRAGLKACGATERQTACWAGGIEDRIRQLEAISRLVSVAATTER